jgi:hypothetical protein
LSQKLQNKNFDNLLTDLEVLREIISIFIYSYADGIIFFGRVFWFFAVS